jgi:hypothetical protein
VNKNILSKTRNPLLPDTMLSQGAYDEILKVDPTYFGLDAKGVEQQPKNIRKNIPLGLGTAQTTPMTQPPMTRSMPMNMPSMEEPQPEQDSTNFLGSLLAQGTAMLGAGIQGGDVGQVGRSFEAGRQRAEQDRKAKALVDPKSEESKRRRMVFEKALDFKIPEEYSATDLNDPVVLQSIRDKRMQELAPKGGTGIGVRSKVGQGKEKQQKRDEIDKEDVKKISAMEDLNNSIDNLITSVDTYGRAYVGEEAQNQDDLMYGIAASSGVIKGQGAMTESDIKFWQGVLSPSKTGSKEDYINRMKKKKNEYIKGITKSLELKGYSVKQNSDGKYQIFDKNENYIGQY